MSDRYFVSAPSNGVSNGEQFSQRLASVSLAAADWDAALVEASYPCPRAFIPAADGTLAVKALDDSAVVNVKVVAGMVYAIAIKHIDQSACSAALQIADAVTLLY